MTPQEAIDIIKDPNRHYKAKADGAYEYKEFVEALEMAKQALEKQIPKKVKNKVCASNQIYYGKCPNCGNIVNDTVNIKICNNVKCGQALDWSDDK